MKNNLSFCVVLFFLSFCSLLLLHWKIDWENRKINDIGNDCLVSVDGTDFALAWGSNQRRLSCYKLKGKPGLRYKVAVCLRTSDIVWISGPHYPGLYNDLTIFRMGLINMFDEHERCEADDGYMGECPLKCKCPSGVTRRAERDRMHNHQRSRQEHINERFKNWGCMHEKFRHSISKHRTCFNCVALLTQLAIEHGEELFSIEYDDNLTDQDVGL